MGRSMVGPPALAAELSTSSIMACSIWGKPGKAQTSCTAKPGAPSGFSISRLPAADHWVLPGGAAGWRPPPPKVAAATPAARNNTAFLLARRLPNGRAMAASVLSVAPAQPVAERSTVSDGAPRSVWTTGPRDRARSEGLAALSDTDLLALVVGHGVRGQPVMELAAQVLERLGGLSGLTRAGPALLGEVPGLGVAKALRLAACAEIGRRIQLRAAEPRELFATPEAVAASFTARIGMLDHEQMWVLSVDGRNRLRGVRCVAQGGQHGLVVAAREILRAALSDAASGFVLVHNHPSGEPTPSPADVEMTRAVAAAADVVGVPLLDHVIVTASGAYASLLDAGLIDPAASGSSE